MCVLPVVVERVLKTRCNALTASMLLLPLLQLHSMTLQSWTSCEKTLIGTVLDVVVQHVNAGTTYLDATSTYSLVLPALESYDCLVYEQLATILTDSEREKWLKHVEVSILSFSACTKIPRLLTCLVAALLVRCQDLAGAQQCIAVLRQICAKDSIQVSKFMLT